MLKGFDKPSSGSKLYFQGFKNDVGWLKSFIQNYSLGVSLHFVSSWIDFSGHFISANESNLPYFVGMLLLKIRLRLIASATVVSVKSLYNCYIPVY